VTSDQRRVEGGSLWTRNGFPVFCTSRALRDDFLRASDWRSRDAVVRSGRAV
jgi:hypothetical protein